MREIKFRGWNGKEMLDVYYVTRKGIGALGNGGMIIPKDDGSRAIMQFTGLTDINGVDIYEGDIVLVPGTGNCEVKISPYYGVVYSDIFGYERPHADCAAELDYPSVIGNIYQNSDLLS